MSKFREKFHNAMKSAVDTAGTIFGVSLILPIWGSITALEDYVNRNNLEPNSSKKPYSELSSLQFSIVEKIFALKITLALGGIIVFGVPATIVTGTIGLVAGSAVILGSPLYAAYTAYKANQIEAEKECELSRSDFYYMGYVGPQQSESIRRVFVDSPDLLRGYSDVLDEAQERRGKLRLSSKPI